MSEFTNTPRTDEQIKRYTHQPLTIDHYGIHASIKENGKIVIKGIPDSNGEYDEVEIPASLIFKLASALRMTRSVKIVNTTEEK